MAASNWAEHRAAASGKNELNYIIRRNASNTEKKSSDLYARVKKDMPSLEAEMRRQAQSASKKLSATGRRQIYTGVLDRYYSEVLPEYGFDYITRKKGYNYNR